MKGWVVVALAVAALHGAHAAPAGRLVHVEQAQFIVITGKASGD